MIFGRITYLLLALFLGASTSIVRSQTAISGVVNQYVTVLTVVPCDSAVQVGNPKVFSAGDLVFIIQMKGAKVYTAKDSTSGLITDLAGAGNAEFLTVGSVTADMVTFTTRLANNYDPAGIVQLIKVPRYTNARVTSALTCAQWNGTVGGVLVLDVANDLILSAPVDVDRMGFAGGNASNNNQTVDIPDWTTPWTEGRGGEKGEGIAVVPGFLPIACRARWANGGGGGNGANSGGGGGSNGGAGGHGGNPLSYNLANLGVGGVPGVRVDTVASIWNRLVMGGGGGGGHQNDGLGTAGGNGGGIIVIRAKRLLPQGNIISANGGSSLSTRESDVGDGTGGGGAGGTIFLDVETVATIATITATGGNSGNILARYNPHGPGGGGGGGTIVFARSTANVNTNVSGGVPGYHTQPENLDYLGSWGAQPGKNGVVLDTFQWKTPISIALDAWGGGPFCGTQTVQLFATPGFASYQWSNGATTSTTSVNKTGTYTLTAVDPSGCVHTAGPLRAWENSPQYSIATSIDFGTVDYKRKYIRIVPLVNTDDEDIVVSHISSAPYFSLLAPISFPVTIPAGQSIDIVVQLFTNEVRDYHEVLTVSVVSPCPDTGYIALDAKINVVHAHYSVPDTSAPVGASGYGIPLRVRLDPDTLVLPGTHMITSLRFDSRIFAPSLLTRGRIIGDVIDVVASTRTLTIEFDSIDVSGPECTLTTIIGTVLNSYVTECKLDIIGVEYLEVFQNPVDTITDGSLIVSPVCFQKGRQIKTFGTSSATITPNPATDYATLSLELSAPGAYRLLVTSVSGVVIDTIELDKQGYVTELRSVIINVSRWPSGIYGITLVAPLSTTSTTLVVDR